VLSDIRGQRLFFLFVLNNILPTEQQQPTKLIVLTYRNGKRFVSGANYP